jgi:hypothetical protein
MIKGNYLTEIKESFSLAENVFRWNEIFGRTKYWKIGKMTFKKLLMSKQTEP